MYISKEFKFEAAHVLPRHRGKCSRLHGHSFRLQVEIHDVVHKESGFVMDYADLKAMVQPIVDRFDHRLLNNFIRYSSSENIAAYIAHELRAKLFVDYATAWRLIVRVSETQSTWAVWDSNCGEDCRLLDADDPTAEWRSPEIEDISDIPVAMANLERMLPDLYSRYENALTMLEQLRLYVQTMDRQPQLPNFEAAKLQEQEVVNDRKVGK